jgi:hypothetical protein
MCFIYIGLNPPLSHFGLSIIARLMYNIRLPKINNNSCFKDTNVKDNEELKDSHG